MLMIFTITPLTNWGPIVLALTGGAPSSSVADQFRKRREKTSHLSIGQAKVSTKAHKQSVVYSNEKSIYLKITDPDSSKSLCLRKKKIVAPQAHKHIFFILFIAVDNQTLNSIVT